MQINIPDNAARLLESRATQAGYQSVEQYVLALLLPSSAPQESQTAEDGEKSFYEAAIESGFIGNGSEYPPDVSSNPDHMKGFGD